MLELLINKDEWDALPRHLQVIIDTASKAVNQDILDEYTARNNRALRELVDVHGVELRKLPDDVIAEFKVIAKDILEENAAKDPTVNKVYQSYKKFKEEVSAYHKVSEDAFVEARND
jgi:TRAP-type mannitol/chloroaromatic compound transport system substrate-binding protein